MGILSISTALLGLVLVASGMEVGKEYVYEYNGTMSYCVPTRMDQHSMMAFRSKVILQKMDDTKFAMKMMDLEMAVVNEKNVERHGEHHEMPGGFKKNEKFNEMLEKPFMAEMKMKDGNMKFDHMMTSAGEPIWSINMKKGVVSMLNVFIPMDGEKHIYDSEESTIQGDCHVYWSILHRPHYMNPDAMVMNVTKVVDLEKCKTVPGKIFGHLRAMPCVNCESVNTHPMIQTSKTHYSMMAPNGDRKNLIIERAHGRSEVMHAPYTENGNVIKLKMRQDMTLKTTHDATPIKMSGDPEIHSNLNMLFTRDNRFKRAVDMKKANDFVEEYDVNVPVEAVITKMRELAEMEMDEENQVGVFEKKDPAFMYNQLMDLMICMDYEKMQRIFNEVVKPADESKKEKMQSTFVDIVASTGHNAGMQLLMDMFTSGEIDTRFLKNFFLTLNRGMKEPTETSMNALWGFCQSDMVKRFHKEMKQCMMTYTALIDETCRMAHFAPQYADMECAGQKLQMEVFDKVIPEFEVARKQENMMDAYIHMAANLKTHKSVEFMAKILRDKEMCILMRMDAMRGMIMMIPMHMPMLRKVAAEFYMDPTMPAELRMLASVVIMRTNPPLSLLTSMVDGLMKEKSDQLKMFVVSLFKEFDENNHPCFKPLSQHIRYLVPMMMKKMKSEWFRKDKWTSHVCLSSGYDPKYDYGGHMMTSMIMSSNSYLPRQVYMGMGDYFANFMFDNVGVTMMQTGMDRLVDMLKSPRRMGTKMGRNLWNFLGRRRVARDASMVNQEVHDMDEKLKIKTKEYEPMKMEMIISAYGHDLLTMKMNESHFETLMNPEYKPGTMLNNWLSSDRDIHRFLNMRDLTFMVPTTFGLPAMLNVRLPAVYSYKRKESSFNMENDGNMHLKLNRRIMYDAHLMESFSMALPFTHQYFGVGMDKRVGLNLPLNIDASANMMTGKMQLNKDFMLPRDVVNYHFTPFTFIRSWNDPSTNNDLPMYTDEELHKFDHDVMGDMSGVSMKVSGSRLPTEDIFADMKRWYFDSDMTAKWYYMMANPNWHPRKLDIRMEPASTHPTSGRTLDISYKLTEPEAAPPPSKFEEFTSDLPQSFVHVLNIEDHFKSDMDRKAHLEMRYSFLPDKTQHWMQMFYDRTPFSSKERDHTKMCMVAKMTQSQTDWSKLNKDEVAHINDGQNMEVKMDINYGKNCKTGSEIHANIHYEHSDQQKQWLKELSTGKTVGPMDRNPYMRFYKSCVKYLEKGLIMPYYCHKLIVHSSQLNKMVVDIGMDNVKLDQHPILSTLYMRMKSRYYPYLQRHFLRGMNETPGRIHIESTVHDMCMGERTADVKFEGPRHSSMWMGVPVSHGAHLAPRTANHLGVTNLMSYNRAFYHRYCDMQMNSMRTFDGKLYEIPDSKCYSIVAKDCSTHKLFTLLAANNDEGGKNMRLYLDNHKIEIMRKGGKMMLNMDGTEEEMVVKKPKVVKNERGITLMVILNMDDTLALIDSNVYGISISQVGNGVFVQAAPYYRGKMCGLCGNFNLDRQHELHTPDGCHHNTPWSYARNFMVPDSTCTVPEPDANAGTPHCARK